MMIRVGMRVASNIMYISVRFEAMNVSEINSCRLDIIDRNVRCRCRGSLVMVYWLAKIIRGRSQYESSRRGADVESRWRCVLDVGSRKVRLIKAITNEYEVIVVWRILGFNSIAVGVSIIIIRVIFSIIIDLSFLGSHFRGFV